MNEGQAGYYANLAEPDEFEAALSRSAEVVAAQVARYALNAARTWWSIEQLPGGNLFQIYARLYK